MGGQASLLTVNPDLDRASLAGHFAQHKRVQVRDVLTPDSAARIARILMENTPWGLSWQAGGDGPHKLRREQAMALSPGDQETIARKLHGAMAGPDFAFIYTQYQIHDAFRERWSAGAPHDTLLIELNQPPFLDFIREVTGLPQIRGCDAQATHYGPNQFLSLHQDVNAEGSWLVAYVLSFCAQEWRPDWGGYLTFFDGDGDIVAGYRPRFNSLNMFLVPQDHNVSFVPPFAPAGRFAITGWFRDR